MKYHILIKISAIFALMAFLWSCPQVVSTDSDSTIDTTDTSSGPIIIDSGTGDSVIISNMLKIYKISSQDFNQTAVFKGGRAIELRIMGSHIEHIYDSIALLSELLLLEISNTNINFIPDNIMLLPKLEVLIVSNNQHLTSLPAAIGGLKSLRQLFISNNSITEIPDDLGELNSLYYMNISGNKIEFLPSSIGRLNNLTFLNASNNALLAITDSIKWLDELDTLILSGNSLKAIPENIKFLYELNYLDLSGNALESLHSNLGYVPLLKYLNISNNLLIGLPNSLAGLVILNVLDGSYNQITGFPTQLSNSNSLKHLYLNNNQITSFPDITGNFPSLTRLTLDNNSITSISDSLSKIVSLEVLNIKGNNIDSLPSSITQLSNLEYLFMDNTLCATSTQQNTFYDSLHLPLLPICPEPDTTNDSLAIKDSVYVRGFLFGKLIIAEGAILPVDSGEVFIFDSSGRSVTSNKPIRTKSNGRWSIKLPVGAYNGAALYIETSQFIIYTGCLSDFILKKDQDTVELDETLIVDHLSNNCRDILPYPDVTINMEINGQMSAQTYRFITKPISEDEYAHIFRRCDSNLTALYHFERNNFSEGRWGGKFVDTISVVDSSTGVVDTTTGLKLFYEYTGILDIGRNPMTTSCRHTPIPPGYQGGYLSYFTVDDGLDNDADGCVDEEILDEIDNDNDGLIDEDLDGIFFKYKTLKDILYDGPAKDSNASFITPDMPIFLNDNGKINFTSIPGFWNPDINLYSRTQVQSYMGENNGYFVNGYMREYRLDSAQAILGGCWNYLKYEKQ